MTSTPRHSETAFETVIEAHLLQNGYAPNRLGVARQLHFSPRSEKSLGEIAPYCPVALWWLVQKLAKMT